MQHVFPVHTGVFPSPAVRVLAQECLPRAYGGVSLDRFICLAQSRSSPCIRGCFRSKTNMNMTIDVFPVHTGVFLGYYTDDFDQSGLPRAYGGVSIKKTCSCSLSLSSPCIRGCFRRSQVRSKPHRVFPVHTGVFPKNRDLHYPLGSLPRAYGGVSRLVHWLTALGASSPCIRGCFLRRKPLGRHNEVFPVHTGVFQSISVNS